MEGAFLFEGSPLIFLKLLFLQSGQYQNPTRPGNRDDNPVVDPKPHRDA